MYFLEGQPGIVFALSGVAASALLVLSVCLLVFRHKGNAKETEKRSQPDIY